MWLWRCLASKRLGGMLAHAAAELEHVPSRKELRPREHPARELHFLGRGGGGRRRRRRRREIGGVCFGMYTRLPPRVSHLKTMRVAL